MLIRKQILAPGTYWVSDSDGNPTPFVVTDDDIEHYQKVGQKMIRNGLKIPVPMGHDDPNDPPEPMTEERVARNNEGWVKGYQVQDGSLWGLLDIQDEDVARKARTTIKYVSPYIAPSFVDPVTGEKHENLIAHVALTPQPLFTGQKPFGTPMSARSVRRPVALSMANRIDQQPRGTNVSNQMSAGALMASMSKFYRPQAAAKPEAVRMSAMPVPGSPAKGQGQPVPAQAAEPSEEEQVMQDLAELLAEEYGIVVQPGSDPTSFCERILTGFENRKSANKRAAEGHSDPEQRVTGREKNSTPPPEPAYVSMATSTADIKKLAEQRWPRDARAQAARANHTKALEAGKLMASWSHWAR
jgi:hypothetical protein